MNNLCSQEYSLVRISHAQYNAKLSIIASLNGNECCDVRSVLEVHFIADRTSFWRTKLCLSY